MRLITLLAGFCFCAFFAQGQQKTPATETAVIETRIYCDHCKTCESCGGRLEEAVYALKGIKRVDVDDKKKIIKVVFNNKKTDIDEIRQAIAASGYDADGVKAPRDAYEKLDDCCRQQ